MINLWPLRSIICMYTASAFGSNLEDNSSLKVNERCSTKAHRPCKVAKTREINDCFRYRIITAAVETIDSTITLVMCLISHRAKFC